ncbi:MAG: hypothetical protein ACXWBN_10560 [Acidimicrobiales bacterium]
MDVRMLPVATVAGGFEAKIVVARLGAEGVLCQTRGDSESVYPFSRVEILVPEDEVDLARELLDAPPADDDDWAQAFPSSEALYADEDAIDSHHAFAFVHRRSTAVALLAVVVLFVAARLLAMG